MKTKFSSYLLYRLLGQLAALLFLHIVVQWLYSIIAPTLLSSMLIWNTASILFCWLIQYGFIAASVELRETLIKKAAYWYTLVPAAYTRWVLVMSAAGAVLVWVWALWLLLQLTNQFSIAVGIEILLLTIQAWCLCGTAVPMGAARFYRYFYKRTAATIERGGWKINTEKNTD
jgi:hypothetical protein